MQSLLILLLALGVFAFICCNLISRDSRVNCRRDTRLAAITVNPAHQRPGRSALSKGRFSRRRCRAEAAVVFAPSNLSCMLRV